MAIITLRQSKGEPLTFAEVDANFSALNAELAQKALASRTISAGAGLAGGGTLDANRTISLNSDTLASLALANSSIQPSSGNFTVAPTAPSPDTSDNSTKLATTAYVKAQPFAPLDSPAFSGAPTAPTQAAGDNSTKLATTAYVKAQPFAPLDSPAFTGTPTAPTPSPADSSTRVATTLYVQSQDFLRSSDSVAFATSAGSFSNSFTISLSGNVTGSGSISSSGGTISTTVSPTFLAVGNNGVGAYMLCKKSSGGTLNPGQLIGGSSLRRGRGSATGDWVDDGVSLGGTWENMGASVALNQYGLFQRIA